MTFDYFIFYAEANIICLIIFGIMVGHDLFNVDRQEKQIKYDHALIAFMFYFLSDSVWAAVEAEFIPKNTVSMLLVNFSNFVLLAIVTYLWLRYVLAFEQVADRENKIKRFLLLLPFILSVLVLIVTYLVAPELLINEALELQLIYNILLVIVPDIYIVAVIVYAVKKSLGETNPSEKRKHLFVGLFPLSVTIGGLIQTLFLPNVPIFCFICTILMLIFFIHEMEARISVDPLTSLNNRGQLHRYVSQEIGAGRDGKRTFVMMIDVNDFKSINDSFGHHEGDRALIIISDVLRSIAKNQATPIFVCRYGGDEFIMIVRSAEEAEVDVLNKEIREKVETECRDKNTPYVLSLGIGYDEFSGKDDSLQKCIQRADTKLYLDKKQRKQQDRIKEGERQ